MASLPVGIFGAVPFGSAGIMGASMPFDPSTLSPSLWLKGDAGVDLGSSTPSGLAASFAAADSQILLNTGGGGTVALVGSPYTMAGWVYLDSLSAGDHIAFGVDAECFVDCYSDGSVYQYAFNSSGAEVGVQIGAGLAPGRWVFIVAGHDGTNLTVQVDDGPKAVSAQTMAAIAGPHVPMIGGWYRAGAPGYYIDGAIARVGFWTRSLTPAELTTLWNRGQGLAYAGLNTGLKSGLASWWDLSEASGTRSDSAGTNHLTPTGAVGQVAGVTVGTSGVVAWADQSSNARLVYQGNPADRPTMTTVNGLAAVAFSGSGQYLLNADASAGGSPVGTSGFTACLAILPSNATADAMVLLRLPVSDGTELLIAVGKSGNGGLSGNSPYFGYRNASGGSGAAGMADGFLGQMTSGAVLTLTHNGGDRAVAANYTARLGNTWIPLASAPLGGAPPGFAVGVNSDLAGSPFAGSFAEAIVVPSLASTADRSALASYAAARWGFPSPSVVTVACAGNSITFGFVSDGSGALDSGLQSANNYPVTLQGLLGSGYAVYNFGHPAYTTQQLGPLGSSEVDPTYWPPNTNICVFFEGINSMGVGKTPAQAYADLAGYVADRHTAGWQVLVGTMPDTGSTSGQLSPSNIAAYNALVLANSAGADAVVDLHAAFPDHTDTGKFQSDGIHLSDAGYELLASTIQSPVIAMATPPPPPPPPTYSVLLLSQSEG